VKMFVHSCSNIGHVNLDNKVVAVSSEHGQAESITILSAVYK